MAITRERSRRLAKEEDAADEEAEDHEDEDEDEDEDEEDDEDADDDAVGGGREKSGLYT